MAFTRFKYSDCRTVKALEESTGPGRYMLNKPGNGCMPCFFQDPQIRMQGWGANLRDVPGGGPIDIDSDLLGLTRPLSKDCSRGKYPNSGVVKSVKVTYPTCLAPNTLQSRVTHPPWMYRDLSQARWYPLFLNPQENVCLSFHNNINTRLLAKDYYVSKAPCLKR